MVERTHKKNIICKVWGAHVVAEYKGKYAKENVQKTHASEADGKIILQQREAMAGFESKQKSSDIITLYMRERSRKKSNRCSCFEAWPLFYLTATLAICKM